MYPTAAKLFAALGFAALAWYASLLVVPNLPEGRSEGLMPEFNAALGVVIGWRVMGRRAGQGFVNAIGFGLTTSVALTFCALLMWSGHEALMRSIAKRYDGPVEAIENMISLFIDYAKFLHPGNSLVTLAIGGVVLGLLTEAFNWRYGR